MVEYINDLIAFLAESNARVSYGGRWMVIEKDADGLTYTVYDHPRRKTVILYEGHYLSTALEFLKGDVS